MTDQNKKQDDFGFDDESMTVDMTLDDGTTVTCAIVTILTVDKQDYIVLLPLDENGENTDGEVWIYRYFENENKSPACFFVLYPLETEFACFFAVIRPCHNGGERKKRKDNAEGNGSECAEVAGKHGE